MVSPTISEVKATDQQRPAQAPDVDRVRVLVVVLLDDDWRRERPRLTT